MSVVYRTLNPATARLVSTFTHLPALQVNARLDKAVAAFQLQAAASFAERGALLGRVANLLKEREEALAQLLTLETGKTLVSARAEVKKCVLGCDHYIKEAENYLKPEQYQTDGSKSYVRFDPLGPVMAVMPWNFPIWQVFRFAAPALMAGNVCLLKHAPNVPQCSLAIEKLFLDAGAHEGVMQNLFVDNDVAAKIIEDPRVAAVTLTGSVQAGKAVGSVASRAIKKCVLELGGSDPFIVLRDADLDLAAKVGATSRLMNAGQMCISAKRFIVEEPVVAKFTEKLSAIFASQRVGDPLEPTTDIGPLAREDLRTQLVKQVDTSVKMGAKIVGAGWEKHLSGDLKDGYFFAPIVMNNVSLDMPVFNEETFGPVAPIISAKNVDEAVDLANRSRFGLGATICGGAGGVAEGLTSKINTGAVFVNGIVKSDPRMPFGGVKESGYGRELGRPGILEFVNSKSVWIA